MQTTQWALAACAALIGGTAAAQSQVTVYGLMGASLRHATNAATPARNAIEDGAFLQSRLGFQGNEDLGGGNSAVYTIEMGFDPATGSIQPGGTNTGSHGQAPAPNGRVFGRQSFVGLSTPFGTVTLGRQYTMAHTLSSRFQPQTNPNAPALSVFPQWHVARWDNMVKVQFAAGPLDVAAQYALNEGNGKAWSLGGLYKAAPFEAVTYFQRMDSNGAGTDTRTVSGLGGTYAVTPVLKAYLGGMRRSQRSSAVSNKVITGGLLFDATPSLQLTLSLTRDRQSAFSTNTTSTAAGSRSVAFVAAEYRFSKRTSVYAELDRNTVSGGYALPAFMLRKGQQSGGSIGIQHKF